MLNLSPLLVLLISGFILYTTRGHYHPTVIYLIPVLLFAYFIPSKRVAQSEKIEASCFLLLVATFSIASAAKVLLVYNTKANLSLWINIFSGAIGLYSLGMLLVLWRRPSLEPVLWKRYFTITFFLASMAMVLVPLVSPLPIIDVWEMGQVASHALMDGLNPYNISYPNQYGHYEYQYEHFFGYPPLVVLWYLPWVGLFGDLRWGFVVLHLLSALLLYRCALRSHVQVPLAGLTSLAFLVFPANAFMLEQSWIDTFSIFLMILFLNYYQLKKPKAFSICLGLFLAFKLSNWIVLPFLLPLLWKISTSRWKHTAIFLATGLIVTAPFFLINPQAFLDRVLWMTQSNELTGGKAFEFGIRKDALSLMALALWNDIRLPSALSWISCLVCWCYFLLRNKSLNKTMTPHYFYVISFFLTLFFSFSNWAFCNYYIFALAGVWITLAHGPAREKGISL